MQTSMDAITQNLSFLTYFEVLLQRLFHNFVTFFKFRKKDVFLFISRRWPGEYTQPFLDFEALDLSAVDLCFEFLDFGVNNAVNF